MSKRQDFYRQCWGGPDAFREHRVQGDSLGFRDYMSCCPYYQLQ